MVHLYEITTKDKSIEVGSRLWFAWAGSENEHYGTFWIDEMF